MNWMRLIVCGLLAAVFLRIAFVLYKGGNAWIAGYSNLPPQDRACYDEKKVKRFGAYMNLGIGLACAVLALSAFSGAPFFLFLALALFFVPAICFRILMVRTDFFIKK